MPVSADTTRGMRRDSVTRALIRASRRLTAEHGLAGFTIEELCNEVPISRRTFFNYFESKEDAVLGLPIERSDAEAIARFLAKDDSVGTISTNLLTDLAVLTDVRWRAMDLAPETVADLGDAVEREPRLVARMLSHAISEEQFDTRLIEQREGLLPGDLRARVAASLLGSIARASAGEFLQPGNPDAFTDIFARHLAAATELFLTQTTLNGPR